MVREVCVCACEAGLCPEEAWMSELPCGPQALRTHTRCIEQASAHSSLSSQVCVGEGGGGR